MICLHCNSEEFELRPDAAVEQDFRGEPFTVHAPVMACKQCGSHTVTDEQADDISRKTADSYRRKHGLLTSDQIRDYRRRLGNKSQREFAEFLPLGLATVKRLETGSVQEKSTDKLIRTRCEEELASRARRSQPRCWLSPGPDLAGVEVATGIRVHCLTVSTTDWQLLPARRTEPLSPEDEAKYDPNVALAA